MGSPLLPDVFRVAGHAEITGGQPSNRLLPHGDHAEFPRRQRRLRQGIAISPGYCHLGDPSIILQRRSCVPSRIPVRIQVLPVSDLHVGLVAVRAHLKDDGLPLVHKSIDRDGEDVIFLRGEIALQILDPNAFPRLLADRGDVQHVLVEEYPDVGPIRCRLTLFGVALRQAGDDVGQVPGRLIEETIHTDRRCRSRGQDLDGRGCGREDLLSRCRRRKSANAECEAD